MTVDETPPPPPPATGGSTGRSPAAAGAAAAAGLPIRVLDTSPPSPAALNKFPATTSAPSTSTTTTATMASASPAQARVQASSSPIKRPTFEDFLVTNKDKGAEMFSQINEITGKHSCPITYKDSIYF